MEPAGSIRPPPWLSDETICARDVKGFPEPTRETEQSSSLAEHAIVENIPGAAVSAVRDVVLRCIFGA